MVLRKETGFWFWMNGTILSGYGPVRHQNFDGWKIVGDRKFNRNSDYMQGIPSKLKICWAIIV